MAETQSHSNQYHAQAELWQPDKYNVVQTFVLKVVPLCKCAIYLSIYLLSLLYDICLLYKYISHSSTNIHIVNPLNELYQSSLVSM